MANTPSIVSIPSPSIMSTDFSKVEEGRPRYDEQREMFSPPSIFQKIASELVGTYILIFAGCGSALVNRDHPLTIVGIALVWGLVLVALLYALGHVSGAHFNPAVTNAFATVAKFPLVQVPIYILTQLGSTLACLTLRVLFHNQGDILPTLTQYKSSTTDLEAIVWEIIATFILMFMICGAASDDRATKQLSGVAIGVTLTVDVLIAGPITGASMNPARSVGPAVVSGENKNIWVFILAPILGAIAATLTYSLLQPRKQIERDVGTKRANNDLYEHS